MGAEKLQKEKGGFEKVLKSFGFKHYEDESIYGDKFEYWVNDDCHAEVSKGGVWVVGPKIRGEHYDPGEHFTDPVKLAEKLAEI